MIIIKKPVITEKMTAISEKLNRYAFIVDKRANKLQIKQAVQDLYGVQVESVNTINYEGKLKSRYTKTCTHKHTQTHRQGDRHTSHSACEETTCPKMHQQP